MEFAKHPEDLDLQKYWQILKRHRLPATGVFLTTVILAGIAAVSSPKKYEAYGKLKFDKENTTSALIAEVGRKLGKLETLSSTATPVDTEAEVIRSAPVVETTIEKLNLTDKRGKPVVYEDFIEDLSVKNVPGTDILIVAYQSRDKQEAEAIVNATMETYLSRNISTNRTQAQAAREFIQKQLPMTEAELQEAEIKLRAFQEQHQIVDLGVETELAANRIGRIDERIDIVQAQLNKVGSRIQELEKKLGSNSEEALALNTINDSTAIQQLFTRLRQVEDRLAVERSRFQESSPVITNLKATKEELEAELQQRSQTAANLPQSSTRTVFQTGDIQKELTGTLAIAEVQRQSLIRELESLQQSKAFYRQQNDLMPQIQQKYRELTRRAKVAQNAYQTLLNNLQQVQIAENQSVGNAQVVSEATVGKYPVSTSRKLMLAGGIGLGAILYGITAFLLELRDPSFKTAKELRQSLNYQLLATIPNLNKKGLLGFSIPPMILPEHQATEAPYSLVSEAYKMLHTNLQFLTQDSSLQAIAITSLIPKEGKSTISANLAATIAQLGKKVLLIDGDLHKPRQHLVWELHNQLGLIEVLQGKASLWETIQSSRVHPNLDVLTAGWSQTEYLSLLQSERLVELMESCRQKYDLVLIDTPPVLLFADTLTIAKHTDGIVLVGRLGTSNPEATRSARELLEQSGQKILGVVVNGVDEEEGNYYRYAHDYETSQKQQPKLLSSSNTN